MISLAYLYYKYFLFHNLCDASICIKKRLAMTNGSLLDIDTISQINFRLNPSKYLWMGKPNLFNLSLPSMCKVLIGTDDSYTLPLMTLCFLLSISTGSNIKRVFLTSSFAMLILLWCWFKGNKLSNLPITNIFAKDVPNSLEIIANRSSSKTFLFLVKCNFVFNCRNFSFLRWCWLIMLPYFEIVFN